MICRNFMHTMQVVGVGGVGLVISALLAINHFTKEEHLDGELRAAAISASNRLALDAESEPRSLNDAIVLARARLEQLRRLTDYTAIFEKTESVQGQLINQSMDLKLRQQPFSVYVRSHSKRQPAREAIFIAGQNDDRLICHEAGIRALITLNLKPDDPRVMVNNRYPITDIGMTRMLDAAVAIWEQEKHIAPNNVDVLYTKCLTSAPNGCDELRITHRQRLPRLKFHVTRIAFENATGFPVLLEQYDWPQQSGELPVLLEQYRYTEIKTNTGLTDADFDPTNTAYHFSSAAWP